MRRIALIFIALLSVGCTTESDTIDPFAVRYNSSRGLVLVTITKDDNSTRLTVLLDVLSPITIVDTFDPTATPPTLPTQTRRRGTLTLHGLTSDGATVPRFRFPSTDIFDIHPCADIQEQCKVGAMDDPQTIDGVVGIDLLKDHALRIDFANSELYMFPDIAGDAEAHGEVCDVVFPAPFAGGGTLLIGGAEVSYPSGRLAVGVCVAGSVDLGNFDPLPNEDIRLPSFKGVDMLLLFSTAIVPTIISESAYVRYQQSVVGIDANEPLLAELDPITIYMASGELHGKSGKLQSLAIVGESSTLRGPCQELYANYLMSADWCTRHTEITTADCPCKSGRFCRASGVIEIKKVVDVIVVSDLHPMLQALRNELRPKLAEADGILGVGALSNVIVDLDYPNNRMIARCSGNATGRLECEARPEVRNRDSLEPLKRCLLRER